MNRLALCSVMMLVLAQFGHADGQRIVLQVSEQAPELKGDLSDPLWAKAPLLEGFVQLNTKEPAKTPTEARVLCTRDFLYVGVVCHEPRMSGLVAAVKEHDDAVWTDDCVEIMLDPAQGQAHMYHWIVNSKGTIWDGAHTTGGGTGAGFDSTAWARVSKGTDRWSVEIALPLAEIGGRPLPGETWGLNVGRERKGAEPEVSSWAPSSGFSDPTKLGEMHFAAPAGPVGFEILSRGGAGEQFRDTGHNVFRVAATNQGRNPVTVHLRVETGGKEIGAAAAQVPAGKTATLSAPYEVPTGAKGQISFAATAGEQTLYASDLDLLAAETRQPRTWIVDKPLFTELLSNEPPGLARDGVLMWSHTLNLSLMRETARRFAVRYVADETFRDYGTHGLIVIGGQVAGDRVEPFKRYDIKMAGYTRTLPPGVPWALDPRAIDDYITSIETLLKEPHPHLWGIYTGDELDEIAMGQGVSLMAAPPKDYPYLGQADEEVRQKYGGGKWGIPLGPEDKNPYRWIAYQRWAASRMRERYQRLHDTVQRLDPKVRLVSTDPVGGVHGREFSSQAPYFDIFTHQYLPRQSRWRQYLGFLTKALVDLTGKEVWPCAHIENYGFATRPEEAVEELSQVFRNGGHGLHLYMPDVTNSKKLVGDTRVTMFGSPRRHHTVMNVIDLIRQMPRPKYPDYRRTAVLYNDDSLQSDFRDGRTHWYLTEACYTFLGPIAGSWFQFIDPAQVLTWPSLRDRFDVLYVPTARYQRPEVVDKLKGFVRAGGTLICGDPQAFGTDTIGNDTTASRTELFGVEVADKLQVKTMTVAVDDHRYTLEVPTTAFSLKPKDGTQVLGRFEDSSPAITRHTFGQGAAILFAANPFQFKANEDPAWQEFFTSWVRSFGAPVGLDIWRFRFPDSVIWQEPELPGYCLTGNNVLWQEETPRFPRNLDTGATYSYSPAPDAMADAADGDVAVTKGKLTDRRASILAEKSKPENYASYKLPASAWMVSFKRTDPVSITFDLKQSWRLRCAKLWVSDSLPATTAEVSADGKTWTPAGQAAALEAGADVYDVTLDLKAPATARYLRLNFAARAAGQAMTIVEAEVWGDTP